MSSTLHAHIGSRGSESFLLSSISSSEGFAVVSSSLFIAGVLVVRVLRCQLRASAWDLKWRFGCGGLCWSSGLAAVALA
jgi:hypothetical protein